MTAFTLELINFFLLLKGTLGYGFRKNQACIAVGISMILFHYAAFLWFPQKVIIALGYTWVAIPVAAAILLFKGKPLTLLGIGISMRMVFNMMSSMSLGIWILAVKGRVESIDLVLNYNLSQGACMIVFAILAYVLRRKSEAIRSHVERLNPIIFVPFILCSMALLNNSWYFGRISNELAQMTYGNNLIKNGVLGIFWILIFVMIIILTSQRKEMKQLLSLNEKCIQEQTDQYRLLSQGEKTLRRFRHDYNDHVAVLHDLVQHGDKNELLDYIRQMDEIEDGLRIIHTKNIIGDAIINRYDRICCEEGIKLTVDGVFPKHIDVPETDLCVLLSNGIRNAYEAARKCKAKESISIDLKNSGSYVYIVIKNLAVEEPRRVEAGLATSKKDRANHGYGTKNMLETAKKNGGDVSWIMDKEGIVTTTIMLRKSE